MLGITGIFRSLTTSWTVMGLQLLRSMHEWVQGHQISGLWANTLM